MTGSIIPFRPRKHVGASPSLDDQLEELEQLETLLEQMVEHSVENLADLEERIDALEAAIHAQIAGPEQS